MGGNTCRSRARLVAEHTIPSPTPPAHVNLAVHTDLSGPPHSIRFRVATHPLQQMENAMATDAVITPQSTPQPRPRTTTYRPVSRSIERVFFGGMAILLCIIVYVGFSPTYFGAGMLRAPLPSPILHYHGAAFTLWMALFLIQTAFISAKRIAWHRTFGTIAFCLPPIMIVLGVIAAIDALHRGVQIGPLTPSVSSAIPLIGIAWFTVLIYAAWSTRRRPDAHKRIILIATMGLTEAAFGRFPWGRIGFPPAAGVVSGIAILVLLLILYDLVSLHRVHRSTLWAGLISVLLAAVSVPIGMTSGWHAFTDLLNRSVAPHL